MKTETKSENGSPALCGKASGAGSASDGSETINPVESTNERQCYAHPRRQFGGETVSETAGTDSEQRIKKVCPTPYEPVICISRTHDGHCLLSGPGCEPCDREGNLLHEVRVQREIDAIRKNQEAHGIIDSETLQAGTGIRGAAAAIQDTIFADREPFDPHKAVKDLVGS